MPRLNDILRRSVLAALCMFLAGPAPAEFASVADAMDAVVTRMYATLSEAELTALDDAAVQDFITPEERAALATKHWYFDVDVPVVVSVLRETGQAAVPFWLAEAGFTKTDLVVTNVQNWQFEVWQKTFEAGRVGLGINGFDRHRPHYLVAVGPKDPGAKVNISNLHPAQYSIEVMQPGAKCYHDWSENVLKDVPESLRGQHLLTTIRGRARDAHLIGGFRQTPYPSSDAPDQIMLTWSADPKTTQTIQWRTGTGVSVGQVRWREKDGGASGIAPSSVIRMQDRMLANDRYIHRHTAEIHGLKPGTRYVYAVGSPAADRWSDEAEFVTAPAKAGPVTFLVTGDTHQKESWGALMDAALARHPASAFYVIAGDLVNTGQYHSDWDEFFHHGRNIFRTLPVVPTIGNHDAIDGLGPGVYLDLFALPGDGPETLKPEQAYAFEYGDLLMISLDCTAEIAVQNAWLEAVLQRSTATWKFATYHFPNYDPNYREDYQAITDNWGALFDRYHVDLVFQGHTHRYLRSKPIRGGEVVQDPADGTIYIVSIAIPNRERPAPEVDYIEKALSGIPLYQTVHIDGKKLTYEARDAEGAVHDALVIEKP
ncbi:MAG: metallophosphoesterase family protein [Candidatus Hydrogenedentes bacterium]|nr:metallophosphoesterase family protein [Candidatus Hydrogenedentota bacterium]